MGNKRFKMTGETEETACLPGQICDIDEIIFSTVVVKIVKLTHFCQIWLLHWGKLRENCALFADTVKKRLPAEEQGTVVSKRDRDETI